MAVIAMLLLCSCDAENSISTKYPCQFYFKSQYHPGTSLETALNGTGVYTMVSAKKVKGAWNIYSTLNDGKNQSVEYTTCLLGIHQVHVQMAWVLDCVKNSLFGNLVEDNTVCLLLIQSQYFAKVPADGFSLAVLIGC